jgi:hypothetical protein
MRKSSQTATYIIQLQSDTRILLFWALRRNSLVNVLYTVSIQAPLARRDQFWSLLPAVRSHSSLSSTHDAIKNAAPFRQRSPPAAFRHQQLTVVWNLLLQPDSEGPPFIFDTASCSYEHVLVTTPLRSARAGPCGGQWVTTVPNATAVHLCV